MLTEENKLILEKFQKYSQEIEENFAQMLALTPSLRLKYENLNQAFTDGQTITIDPNMFEIFASEDIRKNALTLLNWPENTINSKEEIIYVIEHAQLIHECLHQLYTEFPLPAYSDPLATNNNKRKILATIANIIEDSYIEAIGATKYNNIKFFLQFFRTCVSIVKNQSIKPANTKISDKRQLLTAYINYFISYKLYPMDIIPTPPHEIQEYIRKTKPIFNLATMEGNSKTRYQYVQQIFNIIKPLIPDDLDERIDQKEFNDQMPGSDTHNSNKTSHDAKESINQSPAGSLFPHSSEEENEFKTKLEDPTEANLGDNLFNNLPSDELDLSSNNQFQEQMQKERLKQEFQEELNGFLETMKEMSKKQKQTEKEEEDNNITQSIRIGGDEFKDFTAHKNITIYENHPVPDKNLKAKYNEIYQELKSNIEYYNGCFLQMLQTNRTVKETGFKYGLGISSKRLGDIKKRYWYRNIDEKDTPDLAVLVLIDGSGSMSGDKKTNATKAAIILHEVLEKQGINHAIIEHRAHSGQNSMEANILVEFNGKSNQKYNILNIKATNVNRDGLSLLWAERYISSVPNDNKLIIIISDGQPNHGSYSGKIAKEDTHNIVKRIEKHNIGVIGIALEENEQSVCYEDLKEIYPNLINCPTPKRLARKLLEIIKKVI